MGQYHILYNLDNGEWVKPHTIGLGAKQREHAQTVASLADVLYMLLTASPARGGGDLDTSGETAAFKVFGRWCGQRAIVLGDYTEDDDLPGVIGAKALYGSRDDANDITERLIPAFSVAFGVTIADGERRLQAREWSWLFPDLEGE